VCRGTDDVGVGSWKRKRADHGNGENDQVGHDYQLRLGSCGESRSCGASCYAKLGAAAASTTACAA